MKSDATYAGDPRFHSSDIADLRERIRELEAEVEMWKDRAEVAKAAFSVLHAENRQLRDKVEVANAQAARLSTQSPWLSMDY